MQDFLYNEWSNPYDTLCRSRPRSPLRIQGAVEETGRIDSVTNVHRQYMLYSSESRCVHLFQEKVTRVVRPVRRYRDKVRNKKNSEHAEYKKLSSSSEANSERAVHAYRPYSQEQLFPKGYFDVKSASSRSCHSYLNVDICPDFTSPRFVRPCKTNKETTANMEGSNLRKEIDMKHRYHEQLLQLPPTANYAEEFKHFIQHYLSEKSEQRLEGSTLLMDTLSLIMSTISPYINRLLYMLCRVKYLADKALRNCIEYYVTVK